MSQRSSVNFNRFLSSEGKIYFLSLRHVNLKLNFAVKKTPEAPSASPQLLSKLFPQTAVVDESEHQAEKEKRKKEEEGKDS